MTRRLKILVPLLFAAMVAFAAQAAGASAANFKSETEPTFFTGSQNTQPVFTTSAGTVKCKKATLVGKSTSTGVATLTLTPSFAECTAFGLAATVTTTGCRYVYLEPSFFLGEGDLTIECDTGKEIIVNVPTGACTVRTGAQGSRSDIDHDNGGSGSTRNILSQFDVGAIDYTASGGPCGSGTKNNGTLVGEILLKGYNNESHTTQVGIWVG